MCCFYREKQERTPCLYSKKFPVQTGVYPCTLTSVLHVFPYDFSVRPHILHKNVKLKKPEFQDSEASVSIYHVIPNRKYVIDFVHSNVDCRGSICSALP